MVELTSLSDAVETFDKYKNDKEIQKQIKSFIKEGRIYVKQINDIINIHVRNTMRNIVGVLDPANTNTKAEGTANIEEIVKYLKEKGYSNIEYQPFIQHWPGCYPEMKILLRFSLPVTTD